VDENAERTTTNFKPVAFGAYHAVALAKADWMLEVRRSKFSADQKKEGWLSPV
jgi:hypothetical protein